jgi:hypothetical protein
MDHIDVDICDVRVDIFVAHSLLPNATSLKTSVNTSSGMQAKEGNCFKRTALMTWLLFSIMDCKFPLNDFARVATVHLLAPLV